MRFPSGGAPPVFPWLGAEHGTGSVVCTAATLPCEYILARHLFFGERPRRFADLLRDQRRDCHPLPSSRRPTIFLQFPPVQHFLPAAALDPASLKALVKALKGGPLYRRGGHLAWGSLWRPTSA